MSATHITKNIDGILAVNASNRLYIHVHDYTCS